jgi:acyl-CoA thioester hydrolase
VARHEPGEAAGDDRDRRGVPARLRLKVRHYEVDEYGHVNHAAYVHYFETARVEALEAMGLALPVLRTRGYLIVAVDLHVRYHAPAFSGQTLEILTRVREIRGARSFWEQAIREVESGRLVATAEVTGAFTTADGRPVRIPTGFAARLATLQDVPGAPPASAG